MLLCSRLRLVQLLHAILLCIASVYCQYQDGDIRLVGGSYQWEGRVEIYFSGTWGTITDSQWTSDDAQAVCRKLGLFRPGVTAHSNAYFGEGRGPIHLNSVECSGYEISLTDCEIRHTESNQSHSLDVGVKCQPDESAYREGDIRLVGGEYNWEGRVEIYWMGEWGAISDSTWTAGDANVVCRQLQHYSENSQPIRCCEMFGEGNGDINIHDVACHGTEITITNCTYTNYGGPLSHQQDAGVQCQQGDEEKEGDIRIVGGINFRNRRTSGRVEIFLSGVWGTVSRNGAYNEAARVVCRQLGYRTHSINYGTFGGGTGPIHYPLCTGIEYRLSDCQYDNNTEEEQHLNDWGVYCYTGGSEQGDVCLGYGGYYGYVQVYLSGNWVHVADTDSTWTRQNSKVVCRQLGFRQRDYYHNDRNPSYQSTSLEQLNNVVCTGTELNLTACSYDIGLVDSSTGIYMECGYNGCITGIMRLVGGETEAEGRVEICNPNSGTWGTVCSSYWTDRHTAVVCRWFGFSDIIGDSTYERVGGGSGPILMDYVNCTGSEPKLWNECVHFTHYYGCSHDDDIRVMCQPAICSDGQLRLTDGYSDQIETGRLEICSSQRWETLSEYYMYWNASAAGVACTQLGFQRQISSEYHWFGNGGGPRHSKYYQCTGTEQRLSQCDSYSYTTYYSSDVGIYCYQANCSDGEVRLEEGETEWEGRLEVCYSGRWGTVNSEGWTQVNTQVVCNDLGYDITDGTANRSIPSAPSKPVYLHNIRCTSRDLSLLECGFTRYSEDIKPRIHVQDAIIQCQQSECEDGDIKLVGGASEVEGRLEMCFNRRWTTIDGDGWTHNDTEVACRELGFSTSDVSYSKTERVQYSSSQTLPVSRTLVGCYGSEERLIDCTYHDFQTSNSSSSTTISMDVSISCQSRELAFSTSDVSYTKTERVQYSSSQTLPMLSTLVDYVSYTKTERVQYSSSQTLPVSRTLVGCYGSEERLIDCTYHDIQTSTSSPSTITSMDVGISRQSSSEGESEQLNSVAIAFLSIAIICVLAVVILVAILTIMVLLRRRKSNYAPRHAHITQHDTEMLSHHTTHVNTDTGGRYTTGHFTPAPKSLDDKVVNLVQDDVPADSYDEVEALVPL